MPLTARLLISAVALACAAPAFAQPQTTIKFDIGGWIPDYDSRAARWAKEGRRIIIDGDCRSACTRYLFTRYNLNVCMTPRAVFKFHMPFWRTGEGRFDVETTPFRVKWSADYWTSDYLPNYPAALASKVANVPNPSAIKDKRIYKTLTAKQMTGIIPFC